MQKIRVLIVDDAVVVRSRLSKILAADPELEVAGVAATGRIALLKIPQINPDVVILDVEMPEMNGLETLVAIRQMQRDLPVIMFSTQTQTGATATLDALFLGASDYATKPSQSGSVDAANRYVETTLIPKIKALGATQPTLVQTASPLPPPLAQRSIAENLAIAAIGASTGGPNALTTLLTQLPADFPIPIVIAQHMPTLFTKILAERLTAKTKLRVQEAFSGATPSPGEVWIAPGDYHLRVVCERGEMTLITEQTPPRNFCRPAVDVLFESIAQSYKARSLGIILTGMGQDGLRGCEQLRSVGAQIIAQDQATSVVWGMPGFVANAGLADAVLPLDAIADELLRRVGHLSQRNRL